MIVQVDQRAPLCGRGGTGRRAGLKPRTFASSKLAARTAPVAKRTKASVLHTDIPGFESLREYQQRVLSSAGERRLDMAKAAGSIPAERTINGRESEWRGPRPITGWQKVRILPLPPTTRIKPNEQHRQTLRMCDRSGERARLLIWWRASAHRGFESRHILQTMDQLP